MRRRQKNQMYLLLSILSGVLIGCIAEDATAFALDHPVQSGVGSHWSAVVDALQSRGIEKVGDLDLTTFRRYANSNVWASLEGAPASVQSGSRQSAFYVWKEKHVFVSKQLPKEAMHSLPQLELHEALGAIGDIDDHDYSCSIGLVTLSELKSNSQRDRLRKIFTSQLCRKTTIDVFSVPTLVAEGGTSISGGGDLMSLYLKTQVLNLLLAQAGGDQSVNEAFLSAYPNIDFEPLKGTGGASGVEAVRIKYQYTVERNNHGSHEGFSVFVPVSLWKKGSKTQRSLIRQVAREISELFPAQSGTAMRTFQPSDCPSANQAVTFPITQDSAVAQIQDFRGGIILGCRKFVNGFNGISIVAPALTRTDEPRDAGKFYFLCEYRYGSVSMPFQVTSVQGQSGITGKGVGLDHGVAIDGSAAILADGEIAWLEISIFPAQGDVVHVGPLKAANPERASIQTMIEGKKLTFTCQKGQ